MPSSRRCSAALTQTRPLSTATPNSAMKPTPAEILNGMPAQPARRCRPSPPSARPGRSAAPAEAIAGAVEQQEDQQQHDRHDDHQPPGGRLQVLELAAPVDAVAGRQVDLRASIAAWASATKPAMSRPRTLHGDVRSAAGLLRARSSAASLPGSRRPGRRAARSAARWTVHRDLLEPLAVVAPEPREADEDRKPRPALRRPCRPRAAGRRDGVEQVWALMP